MILMPMVNVCATRTCGTYSYQLSPFNGTDGWFTLMKHSINNCLHFSAGGDTNSIKYWDNN
jgi:hypothetical protein